MSHDIIEYFYSAHSGFAYIGSARLGAIASDAGRRIVHRPFHLNPVIAAAGGKPFRERTDQHVAYFFGREIARWAAYRNLPIIGFRPTHHDADMTLPSCLLIAAQDHGADVDRLAHAILEAHWRDDADISDRSVLVSLATACDLAPELLLASADTPEVGKTYLDNTAEAIGRSVFGSPTYFVDGDMFYGQDRLELIAHVLGGPGSATPD